MKDHINLIRISVAILFSLLMSSCGKEWLEEKPESSLSVPTTLDDYRQLLNNTNIFLNNSPSLSEISADYHTYSSAQWQRIRNNIQGNAYTWTQSVPFTNIIDWTNSYHGVFIANLVLEGLKKFENVEANVLRGEAFFYRGRIYYELASVFAPPYVSEEGHPTQQYGIPIRLESDIEMPVSRSTVKQTYNQIITDLKMAIEYLPSNSDHISHPTKIAAIGLLARVHLSMEDYNEALKWADEYLALKNNLLDYNTIDTESNSIGLNIEIGYLNFLIGYSSLSTYMITKEQYEKYEENDLRKSVYFNATNNQYTYKGMYSQSSYYKYSGVATDEVYLIKSECLARKGNLDPALESLNYLLKYRYRKINGISTYINFISSDPDEVLRKILIEREKELIVRSVRWTDLRRLNADPRFAVTITRVVDGQTYTLEPGSYKYTFPIPEDIIQRSGINQNPGWDD